MGKVNLKRLNGLSNGKGLIIMSGFDEYDEVNFLHVIFENTDEMKDVLNSGIILFQYQGCWNWEKQDSLDIQVLEVLKTMGFDVKEVYKQKGLI